MAQTGLSGVTYFKLEKRYDGDRTKNCGLTGTEIDANFHFLRGRDIKNIVLTEDGCLVITLLDGTEFNVPDFKEYISSTIEEMMVEPTLSGSSYDSETGVLSLIINGDKYEVGGFFTKDDIGVYVANGLYGNGTECNPIRIPGVDDTGFFAPVDEVVEGSLENTDKSKEKRYLTKEPFSEIGYYYNYEGIEKIKEILSKENSGWRIPNFEDWSGMLNGLEYCGEEYKTHFNKEIGFYGKDAGFCAKSDAWEDDPLGNNSINIFPISVELEPTHLWSDEESEDDLSVLTKEFHKENGQVKTVLAQKHEFLPIRLVKDIKCDGEGAGIVVIGGKSYETVEMAHEISGITTIKLWIKNSLALDLNDSSLFKKNNDGQNRYKYYVNEYDHILGRWLKKELKENYSIVIKNYSGKTNEEYLNYNGVLVAKWDRTKNYVDSEVAKEREQRIAGDEALNETIITLSGNVSEAILQEARERKEAISAETAARIESVNQEKDAREEADKNILIALSSETEERKEDIRNISNSLQDVHDELLGSINEEAEKRAEEDALIKESLSAETRERIERDNQLHHEIELISGISISGITILDDLLQLSGTTEELQRKVESNEESIEDLSESLVQEIENLEQEKEERKNADENLENLIYSAVTDLNDFKEEISSALSEVIESVNDDINKIEEEISDVDAKYSAITDELWEAINKKDDGTITKDIVYIDKEGNERTIPSGTSVTDAIEEIAQNLGGGDGKVKDIIINDESILDEETGLAELNLVNADSDILVEKSGNTVYIGIKGISNETIVLS